MKLNAWRYGRFHISYLLGWLSLGLLLGLSFGRVTDTQSYTLLLLIGLTLLLGSLRSQRWWAVLGIICAGISLGLMRGEAEYTKYETYRQFVGASIVVSGTLSGDPQTVPGNRTRVTIKNVTIASQQLPGEVFVTIYSTPELKRGDSVIVRGTAREGFASYGLAVSGAQVVSVQRPSSIIRDVRESFASSVRANVMEPMASLGLGFVVGQRSTLPDTLDEQLKIVGLTHIVVASGYNLTILARFVMRLLAKHSRYVAFVCSLILVVLFALFSGFSPSMNRAVVVTILSLLAWYVGRRFHPLLLIAYVSAGTALYNPMYVWSDLGWYLSFVAFAGVLIIAPLVVSLLYRDQKPGAFVLLVIETLSAEVMALPLIAFTFAQVPVLGLIANVLVAPFIPAAMALTAITGMSGFFSLTFAQLPALPTELLIAYIVAIVEWLSSLPFAQQTFSLGLPLLFAWYSCVAIAGVIVWKKTRYDFRKRDVKVES